MKAISTNEALLNINNYVGDKTTFSYFITADGSNEYEALVSQLSVYNHILVSDFCNGDSFPDYDRMCEFISMAKGNNVLLGLGDAITLADNRDILGRIIDLKLSGKLIVICRSIRTQLIEINEKDKKFNERRYCIVDSTLDYIIIKVAPNIQFSSKANLKELLSSLENGESGKIYVTTELPIVSYKSISNAYMAIKEKKMDFPLKEECLLPEYWNQFNRDSKLESEDILDWRSFIKFKLKPIRNAYLKKVVETSLTYEEYKNKLVTYILDIKVSDSEFVMLYEARKALLKEQPETTIANYVAMTLQKDDERIFYLTDNTQLERFAIIEELTKIRKIPEELKVIYPALERYLTYYVFTCKNADIYNSYFAKYKIQKVENTISAEFMTQVTQYAKDGNRLYTSLDTRESLVEKLNDGKRELYWIDALGVEYLGYIQAMAKELGLSIDIKIGRSSLPSLTYLNKDFYDEWKGTKRQTKQLDDIKHNGDKDFNFETQKLPIHLAAELKVIDDALYWSKSELLQNKTREVIIASDHGASRLAVISNTENKWEMATEGLHSGRCCPINEINEKPKAATEEHGFWVLANYDRFKGGRKASVEVHGGASLEEVLVPIIRITLVNGRIELKNMTEIAYSSWDEDPVIEIFSPSPLDNLQIRFNGKIYQAVPIGERKYRVTFNNFRKSGEYSAEALDGDNLIGEVKFKINKRSGDTNSHEEDEFFK